MFAAGFHGHGAWQHPSKLGQDLNVSREKLLESHESPGTFECEQLEHKEALLFKLKTEQYVRHGDITLSLKTKQQTSVGQVTGQSSNQVVYSPTSPTASDKFRSSK